MDVFIFFGNTLVMGMKGEDWLVEYSAVQKNANLIWRSPLNSYFTFKLLDTRAWLEVYRTPETKRK